MTPIFTYETSCERKDDGTFDIDCRILAHNDVAAALLKKPISNSFNSPTPMYRDADISEAIKQLPDMPFALIAPTVMLRHAMGEAALLTLASKDHTYRTETSVTAAISIHNGDLFVRAHDDLRIEMFNAEYRLEKTRNETLFVVSSFHELDDADLTLEHQAIPLDADADTIFETFWSEINPMLDDPFLCNDDSYFEGEEVSWQTGSEAGLEEATRMLVFAWLAKEGKFDASVRIVYRANTDHDRPGLEEDNCDGFDDPPAALTKALNRAFDENMFGGSTCEYNDGAYARQSGYSHYGETFSVDVDPEELSAHERIEVAAKSAETATAWLKERNFTAKEIAAICGTGEPKQAKKKKRA